MVNQIKMHPKHIVLAIVRGNLFAELAFCRLSEFEPGAEKRLEIVKRASTTSDYEKLATEILKGNDLKEMEIFICGFENAVIKRRGSLERQILTSESALGTGWLIIEKVRIIGHIKELCLQILEKLDRRRNIYFDPYRGSCIDQISKEIIDKLEAKINLIRQSMDEE